VQRRPRFTTRDTEVAGVLIPPNARIELLIGSANRDDAKFSKADAFDPSRDPNNHLAFGAGPHFCLGAHVARLETLAVLDAMLRHAPVIAQANPREPLNYVGSFSVRGPNRLMLRFEA
jgi:cytochrome P450